MMSLLFIAGNRNEAAAPAARIHGHNRALVK
jgi:hypothetical protein